MKNIIRNKYIMMSIMFMFIIAVVGTYAFWAWNAGSTTDVAITIDTVKIIYKKGQDIMDESIKPTSTKEEGILKEVEVKLNRATTLQTTINFYLDITTLGSGLKDESFKWELYKNDEFVNSNDFSLTNEGDIIYLTEDESVDTTTDKYKLYIWIDGNMNNPTAMQEQPFLFTLKASGYNASYQETEDPAPESCFAFDEPTKTITRYYNNEGDNASNPLCPKDVVIPNQINGVDVEVLANGTWNDYVFYQRNITNLVLPNKLKTIGNYAIYNNKITSALIIPKTVNTIGNYAFQNNEISSLVFESDNQLTTIGAGAFMHNSIQSLNIPKTVTVMNTQVFAFNKLRGTLTIPKTVTSIGIGAFAGDEDGSSNQIETLIFESGSQLQQIERHSFSYNKLSGTLSIPSTVKQIGIEVFLGTTDGLTNQIETLIFESGSQLQQIERGAFAYNKLKGTLTIPKSVKKIGEGNDYTEFSVFEGTPDRLTNQIETLIFENDSLLQIIDHNAFAYNNISGELFFPSNLNYIGDNAFINSNITKITLQYGVAGIGKSAFAGNYNLTQILNNTGTTFLWCSNNYNDDWIIEYENCSPAEHVYEGIVTVTGEHARTITIATW